MKGALYYDTRYGSTEKVSRWIISEITYADVNILKVDNNNILANYYDFYILGSPIFIGKPMESIVDFIQSNRDEFTKKDVFLFITSWAQSTKYCSECEKFLELLKFHLFPCIPAISRSLPGKLIMDKIDKKDYRIMERLLRRIDSISDDFNSKSIIFNDQTSKKQSKEFGREINEWIRNKSNML